MSKAVVPINSQMPAGIDVPYGKRHWLGATIFVGAGLAMGIPAYLHLPKIGQYFQVAAEFFLGHVSGFTIIASVTCAVALAMIAKYGLQKHRVRLSNDSPKALLQLSPPS